ncbi:MAG: DUF1501 domain-containing protein [Bacteroidota bacterium]
MKRRDFLRHGSNAVVIPSLLGGFGIKAYSHSKIINALNLPTDTDHVVVMIYLAGGNDGLNTVIPMDDYDTLNRVRSHVILPEDKLIQLGTNNLALHPALSGFKSLFDEDRLQIVQNVGYENQNYSHFRSTDIWMSGSDSDEIVNTGLHGRYLNYEYPNYPQDYPNESMPDPLAIELGYGSSLLFQGPSANMGMVISDPTDFYNLVNNEEDPAPNTNAGDRLSYVRLIARQSQVYGEVVKTAASNINQQSNYPDNNYLAEQLKIVARLIAGGLKTRLYMVQLNGFDTHDNQVMASDHTQGEHNNLLTMLNNAVMAFMQDAEFLGIDNRVVGMTFSEFGRRIVSNASNGTDHGASAPLFLFGNGIKGGVVGENPFIPANATYEDNLDWKIDFRSIYASLFNQWLCVDDLDMGNIMLQNFEGHQVVKDGFACMTTSLHDEHQLAGKSYVNAFPNPFQHMVNLEFEAEGNDLQIQIIDVSGKIVAVPVRGRFAPGKHQMAWDGSQLMSGTYFVRYMSEGVVQTKGVVKM